MDFLAQKVGIVRKLAELYGHGLVGYSVAKFKNYQFKTFNYLKIDSMT